MITGKDMYGVLAAIVPLYVAMILAYCSVRWWKIFTPDQCSGINRFVAVFAIPFLSFHFISSNNPYKMNYRFIAADSLQKVVILSALFLWQAFSKHGSLEWMITLFSLSTIPNNLIMGIPLLGAMYGDSSRDLMVQILVLQNMIWYTLLLFMFEYRGAKLLITDQFLETAGSFRVDSDAVSLDGREPTPRASSFNQTHFYSSSNPSPVSESNSNTVNRTTSTDLGVSADPSAFGTKGANASPDGNNLPKKCHDVEGRGGGPRRQHMPPTSAITIRILIMVSRKLIRNPNTYSSVLGLAWSLISFKWNLTMPTIISGSVSILSDASLGMAVFSLGLFMALQPKIIACGNSVAAFAMALRFLTSPAVIAATASVIGIRGTLLHVTIVQAALAQGIVPFVFAREYNVHPDVLSTAVVFGMLVALPVTILYYVLLGL